MSTGGVEIVRGDASRIAELEPLWHALREHHGSLTEHWGELRDPGESWTRRRRNYAEILDEGGALFLAVADDGRTVGHAICERAEGGSPTWRWPERFVALIDLVVLPEARGAGAGEALIHAVEEEARAFGAGAVDLLVVADNEGARRFYERHGYRADIVNYRKPL